MQSSSRTQVGKPWIPFRNNTDHIKSAQPVKIPSDFANTYDDPPVLSYANSLRAIWYRLTHHGPELRTIVPGVRLSDGSTCFPLRSCDRSGLMYKPATDWIYKVLHMVYPDGLAPFGAFLELNRGVPSCPYRPWSIIPSADWTSRWLAEGTFSETKYRRTDTAVSRTVPTTFKAWKSWDKVKALAKAQLIRSDAQVSVSLMQDASPTDDVPDGEHPDPEDDRFWDMTGAAGAVNFDYENFQVPEHVPVKCLGWRDRHKVIQTEDGHGLKASEDDVIGADSEQNDSTDWDTFFDMSDITGKEDVLEFPDL